MKPLFSTVIGNLAAVSMFADSFYTSPFLFPMCLVHDRANMKAQMSPRLASTGD